MHLLLLEGYSKYAIWFLRDLHNKIDSSFLLGSFPLAAASRVLRSSVISCVSPRINTVKNNMFVGIPLECNAFLNSVRAVNTWQTGIGDFKKHVLMYSAAMLYAVMEFYLITGDLMQMF